MPPLVQTIIAFVQLAIKAAPVATEVYTQGKELIRTLFKSGLITVEQQNRLMQWADAHQAATLAGNVPPELQVEP